ARVAVLPHQARELLAGVPADLHQVTDDDALVGARAGQVAESHQFPLDPVVAGVFVADDRKGHGLGAREELPQLVYCRQIVERHDGFHPPSWTEPKPASDSFHVGIKPPLQTHFILEKAGASLVIRKMRAWAGDTAVKG